MDKNILLQLAETVKEIEDLKRRIADAEKKREQYEKLRVSDVVKGTKTEWMINGPIKITGIDMKDVAYQEKLLARRLESMQRLLDKLERQRTEAEEYIANNPIDPFKRKVMLAIVSHAGKLDNDNIEIKTFIDAAIKGIFVLDDSPAYLSLYLDTIEDTREYTEMFLGDPSIILQTYLHII